ncbi:hypothetical protein [Halonotius aquaticus]|uniref:hypothetical protein n=1 Tax=Halonotius aquaticus TaxID=2216978 RepID=UPI0010588038|nr:hypothetical protein [Halonotius aquaticus]
MSWAELLLSPAATAEIVTGACRHQRRYQPCRPHRAVGIVDAAAVHTVEALDTHTCRWQDRHPTVATRSPAQSIVEAAVHTRELVGIDLVVDAAAGHAEMPGGTPRLWSSKPAVPPLPSGSTALWSLYTLPDRSVSTQPACCVLLAGHCRQ